MTDVHRPFVLFQQPAKNILPSAGAVLLGAVFFVGFVLYPLIRSTYNFELSYNEGWNAYHQIAAIQGHLYPKSLGYVITNYTPLSFYIVGYLSHHSDPIIVGRLMSIISFFVIIIAVGVTARNIGVSRAEALLASAMCVGLLGASFSSWIGIDDPQFLGTAVSTLGFMVWSRIPQKKLFSVGALCIFLVAGLIKQTLFVIPVSIIIELFFRDRGRCLRFCVISGVLITITMAALYGIYGKGIFLQFCSPRQYNIHAGLTSTLHYIMSLSAGLPLALIVLVMYLHSRENRLILIYLVVALFAGGVLSGGAGTSINMFIDVALALSLATASIVRCLREELYGDNRLIGAFIAMSVYGPMLHLPNALENFAEGISGSGPQSMSANARQFQDDLNFMKNQPGQAFCQSPILCFRAGRPLLFDAFNAQEAISRGRLDPQPLLTQFIQKHFAVVQLPTQETALSFSPPLDISGTAVMQDSLRALEKGYYMARQDPRYSFFLPRP
jgi:hypothetical protein